MNNTSFSGYSSFQFNLQQLLQDVALTLVLTLVIWILRKVGIRVRNAERAHAQKIEELGKKIEGSQQQQNSPTNSAQL